MKKVLLFLLMLITQNLLAQTDKRFRLSASFLYSNNIGGFNAKSSNHFLLGQVGNGYGGALDFDKVIYKGWSVGFHISSFSTKFNSDKIRQQLINRYQVSNAYVTISGPHTLQVYQLGFDFFKEFNIDNLSINPFLRLAFGGIGYDGNFKTRIKQKDDNYFSEQTIKFNIGDLEDFYPSLGVFATYPINNICYIHFCIQYSVATIRTNFVESKTDLFRDTSTHTYQISQPLSSLQGNIGIGFRLGKKKF